MDKCTIKFIIPSHKSMHSYLTYNDLKFPPRFDSFMSIDGANSCVTDSVRVSCHKFYPFILNLEEWHPFRSVEKNKNNLVRFVMQLDVTPIFSPFTVASSPSCMNTN